MTAPESNRSPIQEHFEEAVHIPLTETAHFDREGFSGDIFVPKSAEMGFTAMQIVVDGEHPRKEILKGTTRSYYVVAGEGTFTLNDNTNAVTAGDLIVIPPENEYEYAGKMTLFEFNVSRTNSFRDKVVGPEEPPTETQPSEQDIARQLRREQRDSLAQAIAQLISRGYTFTSRDFAEIFPHYGYPRTYQIANLVGTIGFRRLVSYHGAAMRTTKYKGHVIYYDHNLPPEETDLEKTKMSVYSRRRSLAASAAARQQNKR